MTKNSIIKNSVVLSLCFLFVAVFVFTLASPAFADSAEQVLIDKNTVWKYIDDNTLTLTSYFIDNMKPFDYFVIKKGDAHFAVLKKQRKALPLALTQGQGRITCASEEKPIRMRQGLKK